MEPISEWIAVVLHADSGVEESIRVVGSNARIAAAEATARSGALIIDITPLEPA